MSTTTLRQARIQFAAAVWLLESFRDGKIAVSERGIRKALWRLELAEIVLITQSLSMIPSPNDDLDKRIAWSFTPPPDNWIAPSSWAIPPEYSQVARDIFFTTFPDSIGIPTTTGKTVKPGHAKPFSLSQLHSGDQSPMIPSIAFFMPRPSSNSPRSYTQLLLSIHPLLVQLHNLNLLAHQQLTHALEVANKTLSTSRRLLSDVNAMQALSSTASGTFSSDVSYNLGILGSDAQSLGR